MSVITVKTAIVQKLNAMQTLSQTYGYPAANYAGSYPYAVVTLKRTTAEPRSTATNLRHHFFKVSVYQETSKVGQGPQNAETIMTNVVDEMEQAFDMDITLSGTCHYCRPIQWDATYRNRDLDNRVTDFELEAVELVTAKK